MIIGVIDDGAGAGGSLTLRGIGGAGDHRRCGCKEQNTYLLPDV